MKKALITGVAGQDGSYLAELLLEKGYEVHGFERPCPKEELKTRFSRILGIFNKIHVHEGTIEDHSQVKELIRKTKPDECYHLAAQTFVGASFENESQTLNTNINGTLNFLSALREFKADARFFFAASSEIFGKAAEMPQTENTRFHPRSPYGISKAAGYYLVQNYREAYNLHASSGILYNHESPRRGAEFVTRKITSHAAKIKLGTAKELRLGNLESRRDWGHAKEYVEGMWLMLQQPKPDDYILATGRTHPVKEFVDAAFRAVQLDYKDYVVVDPKFFRPTEVDVLVGNAHKAKEKLRWEPKIPFEDIVKEMVEADLRIEQERGGAK